MNAGNLYSEKAMPNLSPIINERAYFTINPLNNWIFSKFFENFHQFYRFKNVLSHYNNLQSG